MCDLCTNNLEENNENLTISKLRLRNQILTIKNKQSYISIIMLSTTILSYILSNSITSSYFAGFIIQAIIVIIFSLKMNSLVKKEMLLKEKLNELSLIEF